MNAMRRTSNGDIWLARNDPKVAADLDAKYLRRPGTLLWRPRFRYKNYKMLTPYFNKTAYIVGKGYSIEDLDSSHFEDDSPVICLNEAVLSMEALNLRQTLIGVRQEGHGMEISPKEAFMLIPTNICGLYEGYENTITFTPDELGITEAVPSVCIGLALAVRMGVTDVIAYGFDALTARSLRYCSRQNKRNLTSRHTELFHQPSSINKHKGALSIKWVKPDLEGFQMGL